MLGSYWMGLKSLRTKTVRMYSRLNGLILVAEIYLLKELVYVLPKYYVTYTRVGTQLRSRYILAEVFRLISLQIDWHPGAHPLRYMSSRSTKAFILLCSSGPCVTSHLISTATHIISLVSMWWTRSGLLTYSSPFRSSPFSILFLGCFQF